MKIHIFRSIAVLMLLAMSAGPVHADKVDNPDLYSPEKIKANIILGKTTKEQVKAIYGEPKLIDRASAKEGSYEREYTYFPNDSRAERARKSVTGFLKGMLPGKAAMGTEVAQDQGVGARNVKEFRLDITFDKNGIVQDYSQNEENSSRDAL